MRCRGPRFDAICTLLGYYAASSGNILPTFRDNVSVPSSRVKKFLDIMTLEDGTDRLSRKFGKGLPFDATPTGCPENSVKDYHSTLRNIPEERRSQMSRCSGLVGR
jgi:hypothetical protein